MRCWPSAPRPTSWTPSGWSAAGHPPSWSATGSTPLPRWPWPTSGSPWAPAGRAPPPRPPTRCSPWTGSTGSARSARWRAAPGGSPGRACWPGWRCRWRQWRGGAAGCCPPCGGRWCGGGSAGRGDATPPGGRAPPRPPPALPPPPPARPHARLAATDTALTRRFTREHLTIRADIDQLRAAADALGALQPDAAMARVRQAYRLLVEEVVPHERAEQEELYPAMDRLL